MDQTPQMMSWMMKMQKAHLTDYSIGHHIIYAAFSWSVAADEAYEKMKDLAQKHGVASTM